MILAFIVFAVAVVVCPILAVQAWRDLFGSDTSARK